MDPEHTLSRVAHLQQLGRHEQALELLGKALAKGFDPDLVELQIDSLLELDHSEQALDVARSALSVAPQHTGLLHSAVYAYLRNGRTGEALQLARNLATMTNGDPIGLRAIAISGQFDKATRAEAVSAARKLVELRPNSADAHCVLGQAMLATRQDRKAIECFDRALGLDPHNSLAMSGRAAAARRKGNLYSSLRWEQRIGRLDPGHFGARETIGLIAIFAGFLLPLLLTVVWLAGGLLSVLVPWGHTAWAVLIVVPVAFTAVLAGVGVLAVGPQRFWIQVRAALADDDDTELLWILSALALMHLAAFAFGWRVSLIAGALAPAVIALFRFARDHPGRDERMQTFIDDTSVLWMGGALVAWPCGGLTSLYRPSTQVYWTWAVGVLVAMALTTALALLVVGPGRLVRCLRGVEANTEDPQNPFIDTILIGAGALGLQAGSILGGRLGLVVSGLLVGALVLAVQRPRKAWLASIERPSDS